MSTNTWIPDSPLPASNSIDLKKIIAIGQAENIETLVEQLPKLDIDTLTPVMKQNIEYWHSQITTFHRSDIIALIRFFTLAEEKHSQLFAGKQSPVIALNKWLKLQKMPLNKDELLWIKNNTSNRYIPNGSAL
jgi:hypothetical protein